ncbi:MAG TPA: hypothetical protein VJ579_01065 [Candidatus Paceibacterota bacterium]|nr:hypothetical protein [Candidatus Paceibacterota bacterium]
MPDFENNFLINYFLDNIWPTLSPIFFILNIIGAAVVCILFWYYWHARAKLNAIEKAEEAKLESLFDWVKTAPIKNPKWERIEKLAASMNASDWRIAILEADSILDDIIKKMGYPGETMGERMEAIPESAFPYLQEAWRVHKLRNVLAHEGDYDLQKGEMEDAIDAYHLIFKEAGYLES